MAKTYREEGKPNGVHPEIQRVGAEEGLPRDYTPDEVALLTEEERRKGYRIAVVNGAKCKILSLQT